MLGSLCHTVADSVFVAADCVSVACRRVGCSLGGTGAVAGRVAGMGILRMAFFGGNGGEDGG